MSSNNNKKKANYQVKIELTVKAFKTLVRQITSPNKLATNNRTNQQPDEITSQKQDSPIERKNLNVQYVLATITILLFILNSIQTCISNKAVNVANRANEISDSSRKSGDSISMANLKLAQDMYSDQQKSSIVKDSIDSVNLDLQTRSLEAQINSLKENQNQFTRQNESYLQVTDLLIDTLKPYRPIVFSYKIENFGRNPAKLLENKNGLFTRFLPVTMEQTEKSLITQNPDEINTYISNTRPIIRTKIEPLGLNVVIDDKTYKDFISGRMNIYFIGKIIYQNLITRKKWVYNYIIKAKFRFNKVLQQNIEYLINENKEYKKGD